MPGKKRSEPPALREGSEKLLKEKRKDPRAKKAWRALRPAVILALSAAICAVLVIAGIVLIGNHLEEVSSMVIEFVVGMAALLIMLRRRVSAPCWTFRNRPFSRRRSS